MPKVKIEVLVYGAKTNSDAAAIARSWASKCFDKIEITYIHRKKEPSKLIHVYMTAYSNVLIAD